jgi:hypothetical protein
MLMSAPLNRVADYVIALDQMVECAQRRCRDAPPPRLDADSAADTSFLLEDDVVDDDHGAVGQDDDEDDDNDDDEDEDDDDDDDDSSASANRVEYDTLRALLSAMAVLKQTHEFIQLKVDGSQHQIAVRAVRNRVPGKETLHLVTPKRMLIDEGDIYVYEDGKAHMRHFFVFNDLLLLAKSDAKRKAFGTSSPVSPRVVHSDRVSTSASPSSLSVSSTATTSLNSSGSNGGTGASSGAAGTAAAPVGDMLDRPSLKTPRTPRSESSSALSSSGTQRKTAVEHTSPVTSPRAAQAGGTAATKNNWTWLNRSSGSPSGGRKTRASTLGASDTAGGTNQGPQLRHKLTLPLNERRFKVSSYTGPAPKGSPLQQWQLQGDTIGIDSMAPIIFYNVEGDDSDGAGRLARAMESILSAQFTVFGTALEVVLAEERKRGSTRNVPYAVDVLTSLLRQRYLTTQGLFRVSGSTTIAVELQQRITNAVINGTFDARFDEVEPADVASTLKKFVRMLPEPLFPHDSYESVLKLGSAGAIARKVGLRREVARLPQVNLDLVRHLVAFLGDVAAHADENMMTVENIAIVFGPSFLQPSQETFDYAFQVPMVNSIVADLIRHRDMILATDPTTLKSSSSSSTLNAAAGRRNSLPPAAATAAANAATAAASPAASTTAKSSPSTKKRGSRIHYKSTAKSAPDAEQSESSSGAERPDTGLAKAKSLEKGSSAKGVVLSPRERAFLYGRPIAGDQFSSSSSLNPTPRDADSVDTADSSRSDEKVALALSKHHFKAGSDDEDPNFSSVFKVDASGFASLSSSESDERDKLGDAPAPPAPPALGVNSAPSSGRRSHRRTSSGRRANDSPIGSPTFLSPRTPRAGSPRSALSTPRHDGNDERRRSRKDSSGSPGDVGRRRRKSSTDKDITKK